MTLYKYKNAANLMYGGNTGDLLYSFLEEVCSKSFDNIISPEIRIILTTAMSPYNRFSAWAWRELKIIEIVRAHCKASKDGISIINERAILMTLAHEICHVYQNDILGGATNTGRGSHRCRSWYDSITKASLFVCGVDIDGICNPLKSIREGKRIIKQVNKKSLTEVELTHWPHSIFNLVKRNDPRIKKRIINQSGIETFREVSLSVAQFLIKLEF